MIDDPGEPRCEACGTVMYVVAGGCGSTIDIPWMERPTDSDALPDVFG